MSIHALSRLKERYGKEFTWGDIGSILYHIKKGRCYIIDAADRECIICLILYEHIPMKLVVNTQGNKKKGLIVTALPLDIEEWNSNISQIPETFKRKNKKRR